MSKRQREDSNPDSLKQKISSHTPTLCYFLYISQQPCQGIIISVLWAMLVLERGPITFLSHIVSDWRGRDQDPKLPYSSISVPSVLRSVSFNYRIS